MDWMMRDGRIWGGMKWNLALQKRMEDSKYLESFGYKIYSQNDEDGIIHEIFNRIGTDTKTFVEFGVENGLESNCHALLLQGWKGLWIEGREDDCNQIKRRFAPAIRKGQLEVIHLFITQNNIDNVISNYAKEGLDLLSIDIDGNDYHVWNAIHSVRPRMVIIEYNGKLAPEIEWVMAYNEDHVWDYSDRHGASLKALEQLGREKGYQLVATNITGVNAFFVREDLAENRFPLPATAENLYNPARFEISHKNGHPSLNYLGSEMEGMKGVFEYYPGWESLAAYGFYKVEVYDNYRRNTLAAKEGKMYVRSFQGDTTEKIRIFYNTGISPALLHKKTVITIKIDNFAEKSFEVEKDRGFFEMNTGKINRDIFPVFIRQNTLWIPDEYLHNGDRRLQGISIEGFTFV